MSQGYSLHLRDLNRGAPSKLLGVRLGRACIKHDIPVTVIAQRMGVSRQTVYNWFGGTTNPKPALIGLIEAYLTHFE
jgi:transcriptional regulator with XRE-family HTH domain